MTHAKVILVDDDIASRLRLRDALERAGFDVLQADSGVRVLAMLLLEAPEVAVMSTRMRLLDTFEVARVLVESTQVRRTRVVFIGEDPTRDELAQVLDVGGEGFFAKPVDPADLIAHVRLLTGWETPTPSLAAA